ncbi:MAG: type I glyceraldehyde-3-phosphate dehydrogenase [Candidatus Moranbacteria bacterium]|nr:type I glyceraldehyde-3-phosphate dehydrogenase [Candidatus Moranbacteria bacterium]
MQKIRVAINGFGRIGRAAFRVASFRDDMEVVAINDLAPVDALAHLLQYDTVYGRYVQTVSAEGSSIVVDGRSVPVLAEPDPSQLPWKEHNIDVVLECTGRFVKDDASRAHLTAGARRMVLSAPAKGGTVETFLRSINDDKCNADAVSNASCTTNCISPVVRVMHDVFGVKKAMMTTIHSYTADQSLQDTPHKDMRRARAAAANIVPTTTGAAIATTQVIPELAGRFDGMAVRVPTIVVSLSDITFLLSRSVTVSEVNDALVAAASEQRYRHILGVTDKPLVSSDFIGDSRSSIVDLGLTQVVDGDLVKVVSWYDNEWGYANRLVELAEIVSR